MAISFIFTLVASCVFSSMGIIALMYLRPMSRIRNLLLNFMITLVERIGDCGVGVGLNSRTKVSGEGGGWGVLFVEER